MTKRRVLFGCLGVAAVLVAVVLWKAPADLGHPRFFADQTYEFETVRAQTDVAPAGGDTAEIAQAVAGVRAGDAEGWRAGWQAAGDRAMALAARTQDPISKGNTLLRAHTYYRSAAFFLAPGDSRQPALWKQNVGAFDAGLGALSVAYQRLTIPFGANHLNAIYYPGPADAASRPLLMVVGGYDSTMEELYFSVADAALRHGYAVLTYEGPGQGTVLREQGLTMRPDWEKPNGAVLDAFLASHPKPDKIVLIGESLGGYLAPRAAAFDARIDGVVAYDVFYDGFAVAARHVPPLAFWLRAHGYNRTLKFLSGLNDDPGSNWAQANGEWVFGVSGPMEVLDAFKAYRLAPVASHIRADVLILGGAEDHFVPADQMPAFQKSLTQAHSVTAVMFDATSGGAEHCQLGAPSLWQATLFDWLAVKFPVESNGAAATRTLAPR
jgi:alpha-beta hydrolase superfamily lysophospholipase